MAKAFPRSRPDVGDRSERRVGAADHVPFLHLTSVGAAAARAGASGGTGEEFPEEGAGGFKV